MNIFVRIGISLAVTLFGIFIVVAILQLRASSHPVDIRPTHAATFRAKGNCIDETRSYRALVEPVVTEWMDTFKLASDSPRMSLSPVVSQLQSIRRKMAEIEPGECMAATHDMVTRSMDEAIEGFLSFLATGANPVANEHFENSATLLKSASALLSMDSQ